VVNQLREATTVHWHGMELESYYDGVSGWDGYGRQVAPEIAPGHSFRVRFTPPRSGTFMYHTHLNDEAQLGGGLYGPLIVLELGATYEPETDVIFLVSRGGADALKAPLLVNGCTELPNRQWRVGRRYRLRLINITLFNGAAFSLLGPSGVLKWRAVAKDGAALQPSQAVLQEARQATLPGETYDFEYQPDEAGFLELEVRSARVQMKVTQAIEVR
jgi:FtsP/CotA-like multicopper oxidase with cupredoxin domain